MTPSAAPATYADFEEELRNVGASEADSQLTILAREMFEREKHAERKVEELKQALDLLADIKEKRLPDLMQTLQIDKFNYTDDAGERWLVKFIDTIYASIPKDLPLGVVDKGFDWIIENGQGGAITRNFIAAVNLMTPEEIETLKTAVSTACPDISTKIERKINASTLSAIIRKAMDDGKNIPDAFKVTPKREANTTRARGKK